MPDQDLHFATIQSDFATDKAATPWITLHRRNVTLPAPQYREVIAPILKTVAKLTNIAPLRHYFATAHPCFATVEINIATI